MWGRENGLSANPDKVEMVIFTRKRKLGNLNIRMDGVPIRSNEKVKYLEVWLDSKLTFQEHIRAKTKAATGVLWTRRRVLCGTWGLGLKLCPGYTTPWWCPC